MKKFYSLPLSKLEFEKTNDDSIRLKMYAISDQENRNESEFLLESFDSGIQTMYNRPILAYFNEKLQDTEAHNTKLKLDIKTGEYYYDYNYPEAEKPVGVIPESANIYVEKVNDKNWIVIDGGIIWTSYNRNLTRLIKRQLKKKVSVEIEVLESYMEDGIEKIKSFRFLGVTILGKTSDGKREVEEGIEGAHLSLINFSKSEKFEKYNKAFNYAKQHNFTEENLVISKEIKDYIENFFKQMTEIEYTSEMLEIKSLSDALLINDEISIESVKLIVDKINSLRNSEQYTLAEMLGSKVTLEQFKKYNKEEFIEQDKIGTGEKIKMSLTKKSASNISWSNVDKTKLRNDILLASNYKELVDKCYLVIEDNWEDNPSECLKYPICEIENNTLIYNINGVQSARSRLEQNQNATYYKMATAKLNKIYKKLGLDEDKKHMKFNKEVKTKMKEKFIKLFADKGLSYIGNTEKKVLAYSLAENKFVMIPFEKDEEEHINMKEDMAKSCELYAKEIFEEGEEKPDEDDDEEEFACGKAMADDKKEMSDCMKEKEETYEKEKTEMQEGYAKEKEEMEKTYESSKTEFESKIQDFESKVSEFTSNVAKLESEKLEMAKEVKEFKDAKFESIIKDYAKKFALTEDETKEWSKKTETFSDFTSFEKELVFAYKDKIVANDESHFVNSFAKGKENQETNKTAIQKLKEKNL